TDSPSKEQSPTAKPPNTWGPGSSWPKSPATPNGRTLIMRCGANCTKPHIKATCSVCVGKNASTWPPEPKNRHPNRGGGSLIGELDRRSNCLSGTTTQQSPPCVHIG